jgi:hypothetical protein
MLFPLAVSLIRRVLDAGLILGLVLQPNGLC